MRHRLVLDVAENQVLPRGGTNTARITAHAPGMTVQMQVVAVDGHVQPTAGAGTATLEIGAGGPYVVEASAHGDDGRLESRVIVGGVHVGDVWALAGQSNMHGSTPILTSRSGLEDVRLVGFSGRWEHAIEPLHRLYARRDHPLTKLALQVERTNAPDAPDTWHELHAADALAPVGGHGPGSVFARELTAATGIPVGLLPCALGGATLPMWQPDWPATFGMAPHEGLFAHLVDQILTHGPVRGVLWYQGEGDALAGLGDYEARFHAFVATLRDAVGAPQLPVVTVQLASCELSRFDPWPGGDVEAMAQAWQEVREAQRLAAMADGIELVTAADLGRFDPAHLDAGGIERLGRRLAQAALRHTPGHETVAARTPTLASVVADGTHVRCSFEDVNGRLRAVSESRFVVSSSGSESDVRATVCGIEAGEVLLDVGVAIPGDAALTYGSVWEPQNGLVDDADMAVPAFGPVTIARADVP